MEANAETGKRNAKQPGPRQMAETTPRRSIYEGVTEHHTNERGGIGRGDQHCHWAREGLGDDYEGLVGDEVGRDEFGTLGVRQLAGDGVAHNPARRARGRVSRKWLKQLSCSVEPWKEEVIHDFLR